MMESRKGSSQCAMWGRKHFVLKKERIQKFDELLLETFLNLSQFDEFISDDDDNDDLIQCDDFKNESKFHMLFAKYDSSVIFLQRKMISYSRRKSMTNFYKICYDKSQSMISCVIF